MRLSKSLPFKRDIDIILRIGEGCVHQITTATTTQKLEVSLRAEALALLQILIIQKKVQAIKYINSKSPLLCTKLITKPRI
jgi:hypothetical protein